MLDLVRLHCFGITYVVVVTGTNEGSIRIFPGTQLDAREIRELVALVFWNGFCHFAQPVLKV